MAGPVNRKWEWVILPGNLNVILYFDGSDCLFYWGCRERQRQSRGGSTEILMAIQIKNSNAEIFIRRHGPLPVSNQAGWVEKMDESALGDSNLLDRAEVFYVLGKWRTREEFNELLELQDLRDGDLSVAPSETHSGNDSNGMGARGIMDRQPIRQDVIMASEIDCRKLRAFIARNGPILASDKVGWVHKIDQDFPDGLLLLDRAREFFVFPTWHSREEFLERLEADAPDIQAATPDSPARPS